MEMTRAFLLCQVVCVYENFTFPVLHLEWWRLRMDELRRLAQSNPFAVVVLAQLQATAGVCPEGKLASKVDLVRHFEHLSRDNKRILFRVIDAMIGLPTSLAPVFFDSVRAIEEEHEMAYMTSVEREQIRRAEVQAEKRGEIRGQLKGAAKALHTQIVAKFGELPDWARAHIQDADEATLNRWVLRILTAERIEEVFE